jgi:adenosylcobinamide-phosphate synthase
VIAAAALLDLAFGDPPELPHPVSGVAWAAREGEPIVRRCVRHEMLGGALLTLAIVGGAEIAGAVLERAPFALRVVAAASTLACGSLIDHAARVRDALEHGDLVCARVALARFVGRDTQDLSESEIARAAIESLAEGTCDGIVAPLTFLCAFGLRGAFAYKAINTLDSLIGHIEPPYTFFGRTAARLDDCANLLPARISAVAIAFAAMLVAEDPGCALSTALRDGRNHRSPNAGLSEAAMAGALRVRLGGASSYDGIPHIAPLIGARFDAPVVRDVRRAMRVAFTAGVLACAVASLLEACKG